jgi:hypothetical protein
MKVPRQNSSKAFCRDRQRSVLTWICRHFDEANKDEV